MKEHNHLNPEYTFCMMAEEMCKDSLCGPVPVIMAFEDRVVLYSTEVDGTPEEVIPLTGFNPVGERLISVPLKYIEYFMTEEEAVLLTLEAVEVKPDNFGDRIKYIMMGNGS